MSWRHMAREAKPKHSADTLSDDLARIEKVLKPIEDPQLARQVNAICQDLKKVLTDFEKSQQKGKPRDKGK